MVYLLAAGYIWSKYVLVGIFAGCLSCRSFRYYFSRNVLYSVLNASLHYRSFYAADDAYLKFNNIVVLFAAEIYASQCGCVTDGILRNSVGASKFKHSPISRIRPA